MPTLIKSRIKELAALPIMHGSHEPPNGAKEFCVMEAVAWVAGEPHSDHPECACPIITKFLVSWNDALPTDADRDRLLKPLVPSIVGTKANAATESMRSKMAYDWFLTVYTPAWLDLAGLKSEAQALRDNPSLENCKVAREKAAAARDAACAAARDAASAKLLPTVKALQDSAVELVKKMIETKA